jgi:hypothetical protein
MDVYFITRGLGSRDDCLASPAPNQWYLMGHVLGLVVKW